MKFFSKFLLKSFVSLGSCASLALASLSTSAHAQKQMSLPWLSLRNPLSVSQIVVDSITPAKDTLWKQVHTPIPGLYEDWNVSRGNASAIDKSTFSMIYEPLPPLSLYVPNSLDPQAKMKLYALQRSGVSQTLAPQLGVPVSHLVDSLRRQIITHHPELVTTTLAQVEDLGKSSAHNDMTDDERKNMISKIFAPDADVVKRDIDKQPEQEVSPWTSSGEENLQFSQLALSNWIKGGENSVSLSHDLRMKALYAKERSQWESSLIHKLGLSYNSALGSRLSNDELNLSSKFGYRAVNKWYYSFLSTFKTQMFRNYGKSDKVKANLKSTLLSPAYMQFVVGMDYKKDNLSLLLSPYTCILTLVADTADIDQTKYGVSPNSRTDWVNGFSVTLVWKKTITYGVNYSTNLSLFYEYFEKDGNKRFDWENVLDVQFNRFLSTRFLFQLRYYDNESKRFQVKENFAIAFKYSF